MNTENITFNSISTISACIGIALYSASETDINTLLKFIDNDIYDANRNGINSLRFSHHLEGVKQ